MKIEEIIEKTIKITLGEFLTVVAPEGKLISRRKALKKYKGLVDDWVEAGLLPEVPSENHKQVYYPAYRLLELWSIHLMGKEAML